MSSRFAILGTAGHIDHGKTALVRLLTGTDTDRLKEEKARGISIDLGFAHLDLPGGVSCGIVDVPGHERFVKNMLAGACGIDTLLLVVAADEGIMPQTREHLDIVDLLGVRRGVVALTKIDLVEDDWRDLVQETVGEYLAERGFGDFPIVPVSSRTGEGKDAVLAALAESLEGVDPRSGRGGVRLPVDRAFVVEGFGSVVTGTLWRGSLRPGDVLRVEPGGLDTRARKVEVHGVEVPEAVAGQRTAVALAGVSRDRVPRGTWVVAPGTLEPSYMVDVRLRVLEEAPKELKHRQRIRFHLGASEVLGRVSLLEQETLSPGEQGLAQIRLESPVVADRGDRFVIRTYSPARALAGGSVLVPQPPKRRKGHRASIEELLLEERGDPGERILAGLLGHPFGESAQALGNQVGLDEAQVSERMKELQEEARVVQVSDTLWIHADLMDELARGAERVLEESRRRYPLRWGMGRGELKSRLGSKIPGPLFERLLESLEASGCVTQRLDHVRWGGGELELSPELEKRVGVVVNLLEKGELGPPTLKDLAQRARGDPQDVLEYLTFSGQAVKVTPELYLTQANLGRLTDWLETFFQDQESLSVADLKATWGLSRKYSVPILEYLDKNGWTRRVGDVRSPGRRLVADPS